MENAATACKAMLYTIKIIIIVTPPTYIVSLPINWIGYFYVYVIYKVGHFFHSIKSHYELILHSSVLLH